MQAWQPSPQRRVLLENAGFTYAFGNTKFASLYRADSQEATNRVLLLGFGDVRNVLATAAACAAAGAAQGKGGPQRGPQALLFDCCDLSLLNAARGVLLLHLASTIDPSLPADLDFFWCVFYCLKLPAAYAQRLAAAVRGLLDAPGSLAPWAGDAAQAAALERAFSSWLEEPAPGVAAVEAQRRELVQARMAIKAGGPVGPAELREIQRAHAVSVLSELRPFPRRGGSGGGDAMHSKALLEECCEYEATGSIHRASVDAAAAASGGWAANPTLLQPGSRKWLLHYAALPFSGYLPLPPDKHKGLEGSKAPRALTEACMAELVELLRGWQACHAARRVEARFWCCDALALCAGPLAARRGSFDVVDTSNLAEHVGLLSLLALAAPLLRAAPHARLLTGHMVWSSSNTRTLGAYVRTACGADPQLLPTLLGLRLVNDPQYGREQPRAPLAMVGKHDLHDALEWQALPPGAAAPVLAEGDGISQALAAWGVLACQPFTIAAGDRSGLAFGSLLTLLHLVAGLAGRVQGLLPPGTSGWRGLADALAAKCGVPAAYRLQLRALCCWALGGKPGGERPLLATSRRLPLSRAYREHQRRGTTPLLSLMLMDAPSESAGAAAMLEAIGRLARGGMPAVHWVEVLGFDPETEQARRAARHMLRCRTAPGQACFLLPRDHGLDPAATAAQLVDLSTGTPLVDGRVALSAHRLAPFPQPPPPALAAGLRQLLAEAAAVGAAPGAAPGNSSGGGLALSPGLQLCKLAEHADRFEAELAVGASLGGTLASSGLTYEFPGAPPGGGACDSVKIRLSLAEGCSKRGGKQPALEATLVFPWPVDSTSASFRVARSARTVSMRLAKHPLWPGDAAWLPRVEAERAPAWGSSQAELGLLSTYLGCMFSHPEALAKQRGGTPSDAGPMFDVRETIQALFVQTHLEGAHSHLLVRRSSPDPDSPDIMLFVHGGVKRLPDGRPLLHISYVDQAAAERMCPTPAAKQGALARMQRVMRHVGGFGPRGANRIWVTDAELALLRFLLARNAAALRVPSWQATLLGLPASEWRASFVVPLFSDYVAAPEQGDALMNELSRGAAGGGTPASSSSGGSSNSRPSGSRPSRASGSSGTSARPQAGSSAGGEPPSEAFQEATRHKEAGNARFKRGAFKAAVDCYQRGLQALQAGAGAGQPAPAERQLMLDLLTNAALAAIKHADIDPAEREECLATAEATCTVALHLDPGNSKALYRRALAVHKGGRAADAQADLASIPGTGDPAVEALRRQVAASLRV